MPKKQHTSLFLPFILLVFAGTFLWIVSNLRFPEPKIRFPEPKIQFPEPKIQPQEKGSLPREKNTQKEPPSAPTTLTLNSLLQEEKIPFVREGDTFWILPAPFVREKIRKIFPDSPTQTPFSWNGYTIVPPPRGYLILVMDDIGYQREPVEFLSGLSIPVIYSLLPHTPYGKSLYESLITTTENLFLHLPLESEKPWENRDPLLLTIKGGREEWERLFSLALKEYPEVKGFNNHKGSKFTKDAQSSRFLVEKSLEKGLLLLDSLTTPESKILPICKMTSALCASRDIFLDHTRTDEEMKESFLQFAKIAEKKGIAIAIAHPHKKTVLFLKEYIPFYEREGFRWGGVKVLTAWLKYQKEQPEWFTKK